MRSKAAIVVYAAIFVLVGIGIGLFVERSSAASALPAPIEVRKNTTPQFALIDPLIFTDSDKRLYPEFSTLDSSLESYISDAKSSHAASSVSIYFRDLTNGHWTGVDEDETYEPSSMLKVAVMIAYFRTAIAQSTLSAYSIDSFLTQTVYYPGSDESGQYYTATTHLSKGNHTYEELIEDMIENSDNAAAVTLLNNDAADFQSVYEDFKLPPTPTGPVSDYMTAKSYSVIFRSLFNAGYLTRQLSEKALEILTKTHFTQGLVAGVPAGVTVAHKFGEHTYYLPNGTMTQRQLHDCGIIYYPDRPYLLCIMTKGLDFPKLEKVISTISKMVYTYIDSDSATSGK